MTPEQARARAREILNRQQSGQVIELNSDGTLKGAGTSTSVKKSTVLHDPKGEYV
jgi:hypothetical protein